MNNTFSILVEKYRKGLITEEEVFYLNSATGCTNIEESIAFVEDILNNSNTYKTSTLPDKEKAWDRFSQHIETVPVKRPYRAVLAAMFLVAMVIIAVAVFYLGKGGNAIQYATTADNVKAISLTDFSQVKLNEDSKLILDKDFNGSERAVSMVGEAFFDIAHNKEKPFIIHVELGSITVLGTQFNVNAHNGADSVVIIVKSGKVAFEPKNSKKPFIIVANEELNYNVKTKTAVVKPATGYNAGAWFDKNIKYDGTPVSEVIDQLSQIYDVKYEVENKNILACKFTGNFNNTELKEIHKIIAKTLGLQIVKTEDKKYKITGKACN